MQVDDDEEVDGLHDDNVDDIDDDNSGQHLQISLLAFSLWP